MKHVTLRKNLRRKREHFANRLNAIVLDDIVRRGDVGAFEDLKYRAHNKGQPKPLDSAANSHNSPSAGYQPYSMAPGRPNVLPATNRLPTTRNCTSR